MRAGTPAVVAVGGDHHDIRAVGPDSATTVVVGTLIPGLAFNGCLYAVAFPALATVLLREIWAKSWYVPGADPPNRERSLGRNLAGSGHRAGAGHHLEVRPVGTRSRRTIAFAYGNTGIKAGVVSFAMVAPLVWLWTSFDR
jgi:hypothetical protein